MAGFFARRTSWDLTTNRYTEALDAHRRAGRELLDLTASNPTTVGLEYREEELLRALANREALRYEPQPKGLAFRSRGDRQLLRRAGRPISPDDLILTTSTSEAYSFVFRLLCDPGDAVLVPTPSYPSVRLSRRDSGCEARSVRTGLRPRLADRFHLTDSWH